MSGEQSFLAGGEQARRRLDELLFERVATLSRMQIRAGIRDGAVLVNGVRAQAGLKLAAGDRIEAALDESRPSAMRPEPMDLAIVHEAPGWVAVDKPAGMLVHPTLKVKSGTLLNGLAALWNRTEGPIIRPVLVHRLDQATSGLVVAARTSEAGRTLGKSLARGLFEKRYLAIVEGVIPGDQLEIEAPIARVSETAPHWCVAESGKSAVSRLRVLERGPAHTLVELEPVTGRTNQLRIHCAHIGHAILGDEVYGAKPAGRLFLHAGSLRLPDPDSGEPLELRAPEPAVFQQTWTRLREQPAGLS